MGMGGGGGKGSSFLRQMSYNASGSRRCGGGDGGVKRQMEGYYAGDGGVVMKKRVVVVVDQSSRAKHAILWALSHVANKGDLLTLLHVVAAAGKRDEKNSAHLATSLVSLCKACKPEVEVEVLVIQGPKLQTVLDQVKKLETSVLVLGQKDPSPFSCLFGSRHEGFVEQCIDRVDCLTLAVRKQSGGVGGYLVSTRWQKNFWLLA